MKHPWNFKQTPLRHPCNTLKTSCFKCFEWSNLNKITPETQTNLVTSSLLELLIAAKNEDDLKNADNIEDEDNLKNKVDFKERRRPQKWRWPQKVKWPPKWRQKIVINDMIYISHDKGYDIWKYWCSESSFWGGRRPAKKLKIFVKGQLVRCSWIT